MEIKQFWLQFEWLVVAAEHFSLRSHTLGFSILNLLRVVPFASFHAGRFGRCPSRVVRCEHEVTEQRPVGKRSGEKQA
jgi:hypothetical protein